MADLPGDELVNGNARVDIGASGFFDPHTGKKRATGPRMVSRPVRAGRGVNMIHAAEDLQLIFQ